MLLVLSALVVARVGSASTLPAPKPVPGTAQPSRADIPFARIEDELQRRHGDGVSGLRRLPNNLDALARRLAVIDSAHHSLDQECFVWFGDKVGQLLLARDVTAADAAACCSPRPTC